MLMKPHSVLKNYLSQMYPGLQWATNTVISYQGSFIEVILFIWKKTFTPFKNQQTVQHQIKLVCCVRLLAFLLLSYCHQGPQAVFCLEKAIALTSNSCSGLGCALTERG